MCNIKRLVILITIIIGNYIISLRTIVVMTAVLIYIQRGRKWFGYMYINMLYYNNNITLHNKIKKSINMCSDLCMAHLVNKHFLQSCTFSTACNKSVQHLVPSTDHRTLKKKHKKHSLKPISDIKPPKHFNKQSRTQAQNIEVVPVVSFVYDVIMKTAGCN